MKVPYAYTHIFVYVHKCMHAQHATILALCFLQTAHFFPLSSPPLQDHNNEVRPGNITEALI